MNELKNKIESNYNCKIFTDNVETTALEQIEQLLTIPAFSGCKVRIMPDVHAGAGCVIGFTADLGDKVIPNIIGVDINCGMLVTKLQYEPDFHQLNQIIEKYIPSGRNIHDNEYYGSSNDSTIMDYYLSCKELVKDLRCLRYLKDSKRFFYAVGTLGGGNHFIEVDKSDKTGDIYLVIHTGSRNLGKQVAEYYQKLAIKNHQGWDEVTKAQNELIAKYKAEGRRSEIQGAIAELHRNFRQKKLDIPESLCWLEGKDRDDYLHDMNLCSIYAHHNRIVIAYTICKHLGQIFNRQFETVHNYLSLEDNMIRKGAISCKEGERVIIPMNMRDGSLICIGKGNRDWNCSGPHGAGRIMSRAQAFRTLQLEDYKKSMEGIYSETVNEDTIDEAPMVYKPMAEIIKNIEPTVSVVDVIKPIFNYKAAEGPKINKDDMTSL